MFDRSVFFPVSSPLVTALHFKQLIAGNLELNINRIDLNERRQDGCFRIDQLPDIPFRVLDSSPKGRVQTGIFKIQLSRFEIGLVLSGYRRWFQLPWPPPVPFAAANRLPAPPGRYNA